MAKPLENPSKWIQFNSIPTAPDHYPFIEIEDLDRFRQATPNLVHKFSKILIKDNFII